jgi:hypothetical protein
LYNAFAKVFCPIILRGNLMSTIDILKDEMKKNISEIQALAVTVMNSPANSELGVKELYDLAAQQPTVVSSDEKVKGDFDANVLISLTGEDVAAAGWAVKVVPSASDACCFGDLKEEREHLINVVREASYELVQREMVTHKAYLSDNAEFNAMVKMTVPAQYAKLAYDFAAHYHPCDDKNEKAYAKSRKIDMPAIRIVCFPDWVNEEWLYWKSGGDDNGEGEPPRIMMIYDVDTNTAFLLGAKSFAEIRKAVKVLAWNTAVNKCDALPVNGVAKTLRVMKGGKPFDTTFVTAGTDCEERVYLGSHKHSDKLKAKGEEVLISGNSGIILLSHVQGRKKSTVSFAESFFGSIEGLKTCFGSKFDIISGENVPVAEKEDGGKKVLLNQILAPAGRLQAVFDQEEKDLSLPEYIVLLTKDITLPPVTMVKDVDLMTACWFTFSMECDCCGDMKIVPGANPNAVWELSKELEVFDKVIKKTKPKLIILNTGSFYSDGGEVEISEEIILSTYFKIAKGEMKWKEWKLLPGFFVPEKNIFKNIKKDYDTVFDVAKISGNEMYVDLLRDNVERKIDYLRCMNSSGELIAPYYRILSKLV